MTDINELKKAAHDANALWANSVDVTERALSASNDADKAYKEGLEQRVYPVTSTP